VLYRGDEQIANRAMNNGCSRVTVCAAEYFNLGQFPNPAANCKSASKKPEYMVETVRGGHWLWLY